MTANQVIALANQGNLARSEMNLHGILRHKITQEILDAGRDSAWRKYSFSISIDATARRYYTASDVAGIRRVHLDTSDTEPLSNVTDDDRKFAVAVSGTTSAKPSEYIVTQDSDGVYITFTTTPDGSYTAYIVAIKGLVWADPGPSDINFDVLIPKEIQYGLVEGLKAEIHRDKYGTDDQGYLDAKREFERYKTLASGVVQLGPDGHVFKSVF